MIYNNFIASQQGKASLLSIPVCHLRVRSWFHTVHVARNPDPGVSEQEDMSVFWEQNELFHNLEGPG